MRGEATGRTSARSWPWLAAARPGPVRAPDRNDRTERLRPRGPGPLIKLSFFAYLRLSSSGRGAGRRVGSSRRAQRMRTEYRWLDGVPQSFQDVEESEVIAGVTASDA